MDTKQKIEYIRSKCISANPKILALEFGCELSRKNKLYLYLYSNTVSRINTELYTLYCPPDRRSITVVGSEIAKYKRLGRKIGLADVLYAIDFPTHIKHATEEFDKNFAELGAKNTLFDIFSLWNLLNDDLNNQSEECIDFIYNLTKPQ